MNLDEAIKDVARFLKSLRFTEGPDFTVTSNLYSFAEESGKGMMLTGEDADAFARCLDNLVEAHEKRSLFSRSGLEQLLKDTLLGAGLPEQGESQLQEERVKAAVKGLRAALHAKSKRYVVYLPILGVDPSNLPVTVGKVTFLAGRSLQLTALQDFVQASIASMLNPDEEKRAFGGMTTANVEQHLASQTVAEVEVEAGDDDNAGFKALAVCRDTLDAINFFADVLAGQNLKACASIVGEGQPVESLLGPDDKKKMLIVLREKYDASDYVLAYKVRDEEREIAGMQQVHLASGPLVGLTLPKGEGSGHRAELYCVFKRVSQLLRKDNPSDLERRIISAVRWAGRATVDTRREEAFLHYAISLESLILGQENNAELTYRLKVRTAHLLKRTVSARKDLGKRLVELYKIRSNIVHAGSLEVKEKELHEIRHYAKQAVVTVLMAEPFQELKLEKDLDQWFEDSVIGGDADPEPATDSTPAKTEPETH